MVQLFFKITKAARARRLLALMSVINVLSFVRAAESVASPPSGVMLHLGIAPETLRSTEVTLRWDKPEGAPPGLVYAVMCDDKLVGHTTRTFFTMLALAPQRRYEFKVEAEVAPPLRAGREEPKAVKYRSAALTVETPRKEPMVLVTHFGAKGDGATLNTKAIQAAIDACPARGIVYIPPGVFVSGALFLKSDMTLYIAAGAVLQGSTNPADYAPFIRNRFEGWELDTYASLLNAGRLDHGGPANVRRLSIRGQGTIRGGGAPLGKAMIAAHGLRSRGRLICLMNCADVELEGLTLENPPCWTVHFIYSENVTCHDLTIHSAVNNGDGIDPDSSKNCDIFNCTFSTGDDCIAIKSGKNPEGNVVARPTENVRISDCRFVRGHAIAIGSEMSGGVRGVRIEDCVAGNLMFGLQIKGTKDRGGYVEDVTVRDCDLQKITVMTALDYNNDGQPAPEQPYFRNFRFSGIDLTHPNPAEPVILIQGFPAAGHRTRDVVFDDVRLPAGAVISVDQAENVRFLRVSLVGGGKPRYDITRSAHVTH